jgi:hypothetical protein
MTDLRTTLPIGTPVLAYPSVRPDDPKFGRLATTLDTVTRSEVWALGSGDLVVAVEGYAGGIALTHIDRKDEL